VIDAAVAAGMAQIRLRERDLSQAFRAGFTPEASDVAERAVVLPSSDPLSVAAPEGAYFITAGAGNAAEFSRDGRFTLHDGALRTSDGRAVFGYAGGRPATLVPLRVDPVDAALGRATDVAFAPDGTLSYARAAVDPRTGERRIERVAAGRLALARFPAGTQPVRAAAGYVRAPAGIVPHVGVPADGRFAALATHARDAGGVNLPAALEKLNDAYRAFDALRSANHARGSFEKTTLDLVK